MYVGLVVPVASVASAALAPAPASVGPAGGSGHSVGWSGYDLCLRLVLFVPRAAVPVAVVGSAGLASSASVVSALVLCIPSGCHVALFVGLLLLVLLAADGITAASLSLGPVVMCAFSDQCLFRFLCSCWYCSFLSQLLGCLCGRSACGLLVLRISFRSRLVLLVVSVVRLFLCGIVPCCLALRYLMVFRTSASALGFSCWSKCYFCSLVPAARCSIASWLHSAHHRSVITVHSPCIM